MPFPFCKQLDAMDCGPSCLRMIARYYGKTFSLQTLRDKCCISREGVSLLGISDAAESIGIRTTAARISFEKLKKETPLPCIVHWKQKHFVVVYKISSRKKKSGEHYVYVADPAYGPVKYSEKEFKKAWISTRTYDEEKGVVLLLAPTPEFYSAPGEKHIRTGFGFLLSYLRPYRRYIIQLFLGLFIGSLLQLIFPFLTQAIVDVGISNQDMGFIYLVLLAQLMLFFSRAAVEFIRGWILLHVGARVNISLISDFLAKLMRLPVRFFDTKMTGDIMQRISDNYRIETFLTSSSLSILFSMVNLVIFSIVLGLYSLKILALFVGGSLLYCLWIWLFMKKRRELDFRRFTHLSENQSSIIQLISGMQEIKLNNCEKQKRWSWEQIQARLFRINSKGLALTQYQQAGSVFLNETKNILISFIAAKAVIDGNMTLGMMLAVQYIIGQLNSPLEQMIYFIHTAQDARISLERLGEIHIMKDEEVNEEKKITSVPVNSTIDISGVCFQYEGPHSEMVLDNINLEIGQGKVTAIVGMSGSGKTTLIKLLLGFYPPVNGEIRVGGIKLENFSSAVWRKNCGAVMQDGFIFSDTIARNIAPGDDNIDLTKLVDAVKVANIQEFVESLPLGYNTKVGAEGHGLSQGQKQRLLIARAVYKDPEFIFFDEATNALDANNESKIMSNLENFFKGKTVVVVAHRLSTVKNADKIVMLDKGKITESGTHRELVALKGGYFGLVKEQLGLGS